MRRAETRPVRIGSVQVGGGAPISVQSMTNTDTRDVEATLAQIRRLAAAGCEIVRVAVPDMEAAKAFARIKKQSPLPLVADIHFDYRLALAALEGGADGLRLNPGNIGGADKVRQVVREAAARGVPIRIGVNAGSLEKDLLARYGHPTADAMVESALRHVMILEEMGFHDIKISLKSSHLPTMIEANRKMAQLRNYPLHIGVTEAGPLQIGVIRSAVGIGALLAEGIGDTIRVSLTGDPVEEVRVGFEILKALGLRQRGVEFISCPTCGRTEIDLIGTALAVYERLKDLDRPLKVAVMGCVVNGPGEAREADVGLAGGRGRAVIFRRGKVVRTVKEEEMVEELWREIQDMLAEKDAESQKEL